MKKFPVVLIMVGLLGMAATKVAFGGYILATLPSVAMVEQQVSVQSEQFRGLLPSESQKLAGLFQVATLGPELRARSERENRALDSVVSGAWLFFVALLLLVQRRAGLEPGHRA